MPTAPAATPPPATATPSPAGNPPASGQPAQPQKPAPEPTGEHSEWLDQVDAELDSLDDGKPADQKPPKEGKPAEPVKPPGAKPAEDAKPGEKPVKPVEPTEPQRPVKAAELRVAYDNLKKEKKEVLEPKIQQLESRIKELETTTPPDTAALTEKLAKTEARNKELEEHISFVDYSKSAEFHEKYQKPYTEAWTRAVSDFSQLTVTVGDDTRQGTADDLLYLANLPLSEMDAKAEEMFGRSAARVLRHVEKVRELSDAQNRALADAEKKGGEWQKNRTTQILQAHEQNQKLWKQYNGEIAARFPKMFGPIDGEQRGNELLAKGFSEADRLFAPKEAGY